MNIGQNNVMTEFVKTDDILKDMCGIIESSQKAAYKALNIALIQRNWLIGYRVAEEEIKGGTRSDNYGLHIIKKLSSQLSEIYCHGLIAGYFCRLKMKMHEHGMRQNPYNKHGV